MTRPSAAKVARLLLGFGMLTKGEQSIFIEHFNQFFVVSRKKQRQMMDQWLSECALDPVTMSPADSKQSLPTRGGRSVRPFDGIKNGLVVDLLLMAVEERRLLSWVEDITHALYAIEPILKHSLTSLLDDPGFASMFQEVAHLAIRTEESRKLSALKRLVLKSALGEDTPESVQQMHLTTLGPMTDVHLRLLEHAHNTKRPGSVDASAGDQIVCFDDKVDQNIVSRAASYLQAQGLVESAKSSSNSEPHLSPLS